jgi:heme exporter protein C
MHKYANPRIFLKLSSAVLPWLSVATVIALCVGFYMALIMSPPDYQQGETVRVMFIHVPSAWIAMMGYGVVAASSAVGYIWKHPLADMSAKAAAPIGAAFTFLALVTGSLWGRPMWGTWWVWDARVTSVVVLLFLYLGYMAIWQSIEDPIRAAKAAAILAMVGVINLPIIKFSVEWWNTLHQPASVARLDGPAIHSSILTPLLVMGVGFTLFYTTVLLIRIRNETLERRIRNIRLAQRDN